GENRARDQLRAHVDHAAVPAGARSAAVERNQRRALVGERQRQAGGHHAGPVQDLRPLAPGGPATPPPPPYRPPPTPPPPPSIQLITSPFYYHSDHDRASDVPEAGLERVARAYAKIVDQVNTLQRAELKGEVTGGATGGR